jgi:viroplasmin and RNaseH domain-containing protein
MEWTVCQKRVYGYPGERRKERERSAGYMHL